jgi:hypothetical protein
VLPAAIRPMGDLRLQTRRIDGKEVVVARHGDKRFVLGEKVPDEPVPEAWLKRLGRYDILNPDPHFPVTDAQLRLNNGRLCMSYRMPLLSPDRIQMPVRAISDTEAVILGIGRNRGETLSAITLDGEERLRYSGLVGRRQL